MRKPDPAKVSRAASKLVNDWCEVMLEELHLAIPVPDKADLCSRICALVHRVEGGYLDEEPVTVPDVPCPACSLEPGHSISRNDLDR